MPAIGGRWLAVCVIDLPRTRSSPRAVRSAPQSSRLRRSGQACDVHAGVPHRADSGTPPDNEKRRRPAHRWSASSSSLGLGSGLRLPEDLVDLRDQVEQRLAGGRVVGRLRAVGAAARGLGGLVEELVQLRVLLEVRGLEVVGPQHPQVVLHEVGALLLDLDRAGAEIDVVVALVLLLDGLDRLGFDARLGRVVHAAGEVAVRAGLQPRAENAGQHPHGWSSLEGDRSGWPDTTPEPARGQRMRWPGKWRRVGVRGPSMSPTLHDGAVVLARFGAIPRPGDVVLVGWASRPGQLSVKRAVRPDGEGWHVLGDNPFG